MDRHPEIIAILLTCLLAGPANAAIQRQVDSQGVIHIDNTGKAGSPSPTGVNTAAPVPEALVKSPESAAPSAADLENYGIELWNGTSTQDLANLTRALLIREGFSALEIGNHSDFTAQTTVIYYQPGMEKVAGTLQAKIFPWAQLEESSRLNNGVAVRVLLGDDLLNQPRIMARLSGEDLGAAPPTDHAKPSQPVPLSQPTGMAAPTPEALLLKKVSYEPASVAVAPTPAPQSTAPKRAESISVGGIRSYLDAQGVRHITDVAPETIVARPPILQADNHSAPATEIPQGFRKCESVAATFPLQKVSWNPAKPYPASLAASVPPRAATVDVIRRYRDGHGVLHIENVEPKIRESLPAPRLLRAETASENNRLAELLYLPVDYHGGPLAVKPAAWSGQGGFSPARTLPATGPSKTPVTTEGGIRRWRDKQGVWHIKTVDDPAPEMQPTAPRLAAPPSAGPAPLTCQPLPVTPYGRGGPSIFAFRDKKGRLKICNEPPPMAAVPKVPTGGAIAPAALEPLIAEAAMAHRLPATLVRAVVKVESDFCSWAVSPKGAMGLMQLMPGTATFLGVQEPFNPRDNLQGGCRYLRLLVDYFGGSVPLALAAYNAGFQRVVNCGFQVPAIKETQDFVTQVMGRYLAEEKKTGMPWT